jgi:uncharacterized protein (TIGR02271 family)
MRYSALSQYDSTTFPEGMTDVRGFEVRTRDDEKVGKVSDLIAADDGRLRFLDVDLGGIFNPRHVVLPIGAAEVDARRDIVWIAGMTKDEIKALPDYLGEASAITDEYESRVRGAYAGRITDRDLYDQGRFYAGRGGEAVREARLTLSEEQLAVGKRRVPAGEAAIRKEVETEHVRRTVPVEREEIVVERRPLSADANTDVRIGEDEIRVPLTREEVVAEKRAVPVEEVVLKKRVVTEDQEVEADLRRERVDERALDNVADRSVSAAEGASGTARRGSKNLADKLDDVKDRIDANPASKPGPDATDRPERHR